MRSEGAPSQRWAAAACLLSLPGPGAATQAQRVEVAEAGISELQTALTSGDVTSVELVEAYLARIAAYDQSGARTETRSSTSIRAPSKKPLPSTPNASRAALVARSTAYRSSSKDNYDTADMPTTAGSIALAGYEPDRDGFQVRKLREAGAVILAKANMHELAMGITTNQLARRPNP